MVEEVKAVDEAAGLLYFMGTKSGWLDRHLYVVSLEGGEIRQVTPPRMLDHSGALGEGWERWGAVGSDGEC